MAVTSAFVVVGECVADIVRRPGEPDRVHAGGSPANVAYGLARLGHDATLVTELADDEHGRLITDHLSSVGVTVEASATPRTPSAVATLDAEGRADYRFDIEWGLDAPPPLAPGRHLHTGSIAAVRRPGAAAVLEALRSAAGRTTVSYDPNVRPALMGDHADAVASVERIVALSDVTKASDEDLEWLYPGRAPEEVAEAWVGLGCPLVLVTRGPHGALAATGAERREVASLPVEVADTVGAGDAFMSGALHALAALGALGAGGSDRLAGLPAEAVDEVLRTAAASAAVTVGRAGANPPRADELTAALA
ncbi:carbohydrate kinase family protein [Streptomyces bohaiensis]|uniref:carbohydrate kinase family protein n=1 Tax=Streptomyces bohaiensis TaxID=1431344 RepID=UPI003B775E83